MNYSAMESMQHNFILSETYSHMHWSLHVSHLIHQVCIRGETYSNGVDFGVPFHPMLRSQDPGLMRRNHGKQTKLL